MRQIEILKFKGKWFCVLKWKNGHVAMQSRGYVRFRDAFETALMLRARMFRPVRIDVPVEHAKAVRHFLGEEVEV